MNDKTEWVMVPREPTKELTAPLPEGSGFPIHRTQPEST